MMRTCSKLDVSPTFPDISITNKLEPASTKESLEICSLNRLKLFYKYLTKLYFIIFNISNISPRKMSKQPWASCLKISEVFDLQSRTREKVNSTNPCILHVYSFAQC